MHKILFAFTLVINAAFAAPAQQTAGPVAPVADSQARAQEILKQARAAIWDEAKSKSLQSLSITANRRLTRRGTEIELTLEALFPDKFMQTEIINLGLGPGFDATLIQAINGARAWSDLTGPSTQAWAELKSSGRLKSGGDATMAEKKSAGGGSQSMTTVAARVAAELSAPPGDFGGINDGAAASTQPDQQLVIQAGFAPLLLVWLLTTPPLLPVEFTYAGQATAQSDGRMADALDLRGPHNFAARLFIDRQTHQVLLLSYKTKMPGKNAKPGAPAAGQGERNQDGDRSADPPAQEEVEARWIVSDYRNVNGFSLPRRLVRSTAGQITEEIEVQKVKVNPALKADKFENKQEKKK